MKKLLTDKEERPEVMSNWRINGETEFYIVVFFF